MDTRALCIMHLLQWSFCPFTATGWFWSPFSTGIKLARLMTGGSTPKLMPRGMSNVMMLSWCHCHQFCIKMPRLNLTFWLNTQKSGECLPTFSRITNIKMDVADLRVLVKSNLRTYFCVVGMVLNHWAAEQWWLHTPNSITFQGAFWVNWWMIEMVSDLYTHVKLQSTQASLENWFSLVKLGLEQKLLAIASLNFMRLSLCLSCFRNGH